MKMFGECLSALWVPRPYGAYVPVCSGAPSGLHGWACVGPHPTVRAEPVEASTRDILSPTISRIRCLPNRLASIPAAEILRDYRAPLALRSQHCHTVPDLDRKSTRLNS